jgi:sortase A
MIRRPSRSVLLLSISLALAGFGAGQLASGGWIHAKARLAQHLLDAAWQETRVSGGERIARPWPWADTWPVARLSLPRLGVSFIVLSGDAGSSLAFGPGHNTASALPGRPGTAVISGHRDTHFRALARLRPGDRIEIERPDGVTVAYRIASLEVADTRRDRLHLAEGSPRARPALALVTCWPFNAVQPGGPLRYVVSAFGLGAPVGARPKALTHSAARQRSEEREEFFPPRKNQSRSAYTGDLTRRISES